MHVKRYTGLHEIVIVIQSLLMAELVGPVTISAMELTSIKTAGWISLI